jgi:hypothetical protein
MPDSKVYTLGQNFKNECLRPERRVLKTRQYGVFRCAGAATAFVPVSKHLTNQAALASFCQSHHIPLQLRPTQAGTEP